MTRAMVVIMMFVWAIATVAATYIIRGRVVNAGIVDAAIVIIVIPTTGIGAGVTTTAIIALTIGIRLTGAKKCDDTNGCEREDELLFHDVRKGCVRQMRRTPSSSYSLKI